MAPFPHERSLSAAPPWLTTELDKRSVWLVGGWELAGWQTWEIIGYLSRKRMPSKQEDF